MLGKSLKNAILFSPPVSPDENVLKQTSLPYIIMKTTIKNTAHSHQMATFRHTKKVAR